MPMKLSVLIPVYNEKATILEIIQRVQKVAIEKELVVVDDFSTDGTREILETIPSHENLKIIYHKQNKGKGAALRTALEHYSGELAIIQDADLEYDPQEYNKLLAPIKNNQADVVFGSRFMGDQPHRVLFFWHSRGNKFITLFSNMFTNLNLTDIECCYKAFRREVLESLKLEQNRFGIEPEIIAKVAAKKWRIFEVGVSYFGRTYDEGKKIGWKDGFQAVYCIIKYGLFSRN